MRKLGYRLLVLCLLLPGLHAEDLDAFNPPTRFDTLKVHLSLLQDFLHSYVPPEEAYKRGVFDCRHYAKDLITDAHTAGLKAHLVVVDMQDSNSHAVVAFPTVDAGTVYADATPADGQCSGGPRIILVCTNQPLSWVNYSNVVARAGQLQVQPKAYICPGRTNVVTAINPYPQMELYQTNHVWLTREISDE